MATKEKESEEAQCSEAKETKRSDTKEARRSETKETKRSESEEVECSESKESEQKLIAKKRTDSKWSSEVETTRVLYYLVIMCANIIFWCFMYYVYN